MCGIVGYVGSEKITNSVLMNGLRSLEYRGYDSAGIAILENNEIRIVKSSGKVRKLEDKLCQLDVLSSNLGIAHTRWATHGKPNEENAHPHHKGIVTLVHNGIIENYAMLKKELESEGYLFESQTDSEIAAAYIDYMVNVHTNKLDALIAANKAFKGSFAFGIIFSDEKDKLYAMRRNSPLIVALQENASFIASDIQAVLKYTNQYILLGQDEIAILTKENQQIYDLNNKRVDQTIHFASMDINDIQKDGFEHFMLKEIHDEPKAVAKTIAAYVNNDIQELINTLPDLSKYNQIHMVSCGSAMHATMIAKSLIEEYARVKVDVEIASEYRYKNPILNKETLVIVVSQSGETADTLAALLLAKEQGVDTLAIVNVVGSSIAREAKYVAYTLAGVEIAVATTKAYCTQVVLLTLIACNLAYIHKKITPKDINHILIEMKQLPTIIETLLNSNQYIQTANQIKSHEHVFFLGRGIDYALSLEASLKLKEISYIHSEAYAAGELKHGTISLIEEGTPVIAICTDERLYEKTISNVKEVKARGANVVLIVCEGFDVKDDYYDYKIEIPKINRMLQSIITVVPLQMLAYEIAKIRGCAIDQPRNLAKSVTVE